MNLTATVDHRIQDRRQDVSFFCAYHLGIKSGKRENERRLGKGGSAYVDRYSSHLMFCVIGILMLSICDAVFTLKILANGGEEINWFMAVLIEDSVSKFIAIKLALTSLALVLLVIHHNVQLTYQIRVRHLKYMILTGYGLLIGYELHLLQLAAI